ncbi:hypothetical protein Taro_037849 [Colocasia esculenta]|uniref:Uncharacterized protein n=1 Tax=Colocasia esculenta TaxID=4460 RepID=A0A843W1Q9_COLES|nr:hypothetical protein [Colocasia esculenta]
MFHNRHPVQSRAVALYLGASACFSPAFSGSVTRLVTMLTVGLVGVQGSRNLGLPFLVRPSSDVERLLLAICGLA